MQTDFRPRSRDVQSDPKSPEPGPDRQQAPLDVKDATEVVTASRRSELSQRAFCERHGIDSQRLARWAKLIPEAPAFVEAVVVSKSGASYPPIIVELGAARIVVDHEVEDDHLARVLRIVGSVC